MRLAELLARVRHAFEELSGDTPGWDDPWPDRDVPESAYSVVSQPDKWRIVGARAEAWSTVLVGADLAVREPSVAGEWTLRPTADGAEPLLVRGRESIRGQATYLELQLGEPPLPLLGADCQCDACDSGSQDLLDAIDGAFVEAVTGDVVLLDLGGSSVRDAAGGRESSWSAGQPAIPPRDAIERDLLTVRQGRSTEIAWTHVVHGRPWHADLAIGEDPPQ